MPLTQLSLPQQSRGPLQVSPTSLHAQVPPSQLPEQHCELPPHSPPAVVQPPHALLVHSVAVQQSLTLWQAAPHCPHWQMPLPGSQLPEQHSELAPQLSPPPRHWQALPAQEPEQQSEPAPHA